VGNLKIEINYAEASGVIAASRASARNLINWCDRLEKLLDEVKKIDDREHVTVVADNKAA